MNEQKGYMNVSARVLEPEYVYLCLKLNELGSASFVRSCGERTKKQSKLRQF